MKKDMMAVSLNNIGACVELISEGKPAPVMQIMEELERDVISQALIMTHANIRGAAFLLGMKYTTLYAKIRKHGLRLTKAVRFCQNSSDSGVEWLDR